MKKTGMGSAQIISIVLVLTGSIYGICGLYGCGSATEKSGESVAIVSNEPIAITSAEQLTKHLPGVWSDTRPGNEWRKIEFNSDGSLKYYEAKPVDDNWGSSMDGTWEVLSYKDGKTGKRKYSTKINRYIQSGERYQWDQYFDVTVEGAASFSDNTPGQVQLYPIYMEFIKSDIFPFSE